MARLPRMAVFTDALLGDTMDLSVEEFGAYCLILFVTWRNNGQPLEDDPHRMSRIVRVSERRWKAVVRPAIERFFDLTDGRWRQKRLEKEWEIAVQFSDAQRSRRSGKNNVNSLRNNETLLTAVPPRLIRGSNSVPPTQSQSQSQEEERKGAASASPTEPPHDRKSRGTRLSPDWQPNPEDCEFAQSHGLNPENVRAEFIDYWCAVAGSRGVKLDWSRTYRNRCRELAERRSRSSSNRPSGDGFLAGLRTVGAKAGVG